MLFLARVFRQWFAFLGVRASFVSLGRAGTKETKPTLPHTALLKGGAGRTCQRGCGATHERKVWVLRCGWPPPREGQCSSERWSFFSQFGMFGCCLFFLILGEHTVQLSLRSGGVGRGCRGGVSLKGKGESKGPPSCLASSNAHDDLLRRGVGVVAVLVRGASAAAVSAHRAHGARRRAGLGHRHGGGGTGGRGGNARSEGIA